LKYQGENMGWGFFSPIQNALGNAVDTVSDIGEGAVDIVKEAGRSIDETVREQLPGGWTTAALLAAGYYYSPEINAYLSADGTTMAAGADVAVADAAAATAAEQAAAAYAEQLAAEQAAIALATEQAAAAAAAEQLAAQIAAENAAYDQAMQDLAKNYVSPQFATSAAAQGLTFKQALDATRAGLLVNAITGDPLGLNDVGGSAGNNFAESGFAQVPIPEDWKSPTYTYSPVQNVTFEDLFPSVSLQGTQWQNMPQAQTFNEMFASGRQTPMGSPVDINQIVGSILGQSATS
jgi:hypothetical protein